MMTGLSLRVRIFVLVVCCIIRSRALVTQLFLDHGSNPMDHDHSRLSKVRGYWYADVFSCHQEEDRLIVYNTVLVFDADG